MAAPWVIPAAMFGADLLGGLLGSGQRRAANRERTQMQQRLMGQMQETPGMFESMLSNWLSGGFTPGGSASHDALNQFLTRSPTDQLGAAGGTLQDLMATGGATNIDALMQSMLGLGNRQTEHQVAGLRSGASGLGQRFGTGAAASEGLLRGEMGARTTNDINTLQMQMNEAAQGRRLGAASTFGQLVSQLAQAQGGMGLNFQQMMLQAMLGGGGMEQGRRGINAQLMGAMMGMPPAQGFDWNSLAESGQLAMLLPRLLGGGGGGTS